jgi:GntR family transcriptional regulator, rspAB operon transcriptional repressor
MARSRPQIPVLASPAVSAPGNDRGSVARTTYDTIRSAILDCTFMPGMALSEQAVSEQLEVSRAPVREAFRQLVTEGLLDVAPQRGTFVARLDRARIADALFVREAIECKAAALAAKAPLPAKKKLAAILQGQAGASARKDYAAHLAADEDFHRHILAMAGHPHAWNALRLARTGMNRIRHLAIPTVGSNRIAIDHHRLIVDAILSGEARKASEAMRVHVHSPLIFLEAILEQHPEYFTPG